MLASEQYRCSNEKKKFQYWIQTRVSPVGCRSKLHSRSSSESHGSAGARSIILRGFTMGRWLAGRLMKELVLVSCQQPTQRWNVAAMNTSLSQIILSDSSQSQGQIKCGAVTWRISEQVNVGIPGGSIWSICKEGGGMGNAVLTGQQTHYESAGNSVENARKTFRSDVPQRSGQSLYEPARVSSAPRCSLAL